MCYLDKSKEMPSFPVRLWRDLVKLSVVSQQSGLPGELLLVDWRLANVTPIYEKAWRDNSGNHRPVSLTSVPGKGMEEMTLSAITRCVLHHWGTRPSQHGLKQVLLD